MVKIRRKKLYPAFLFPFNIYIYIYIYILHTVLWATVFHPILLFFFFFFFFLFFFFVLNKALLVIVWNNLDSNSVEY